MSTPSTNRHNGRDSSGRFAPGNKLGRGNPFNKRACELRTALLEAVGPEDVRDIAQALVAAAKAGCVVSAREVFNRVLGTPSPADVLARLEALEDKVDERQRQTR
jgi:hypothetical protein